METSLHASAVRPTANPVLERIEKIYLSLTRAERQVADFVLANAENLARTPINGITSQSGTSAPTIMRFCRAAGFNGLTDLKLSMVAVLGGRDDTPGVATPKAAGRFSIEHPGALPLLEEARELIEGLSHRPVSEQVAEAAALLAGATRVTCMASHDLYAAAAYARDALLRIGIHALTPDAPAYDGAPSHALHAPAVGLFFCHGTPNAALADAITRYRHFGGGAIVAGNVTVAPFAQASVQILSGLPATSAALHGSTLLLPHLLLTDLLADAVARQRHTTLEH
jgi:DNA-binding MurR/RpiR family transcriptional regulator